jgi:putative colanic acid biosynthesis acetyltransferase WcaF
MYFSAQGKTTMSPEPLDAEKLQTWRGGPTFDLRNRLFRLTFAVTWALLAAWTPPPMKRWRNWLLRRFGAKIAPTAAIYGSARIWYPPLLSVEDYGCIGPNVTVYCMAPINIGRFAIVSQGSHLCAGTHDVESPHFQLRTRPIHIGARAWVAAEAFVGPGVKVGEGAVLGARAVAMRNLEPWCIYTGNPATKLRERKVRFADAVSQEKA